MKEVHHDLGHANHQVAYRTLKEHFMCPNIREDTKRTVAACNVCEKFNRNEKIISNLSILVKDVPPKSYIIINP